jgi:uncharacterized damage-inducible protein DinB
MTDATDLWLDAIVKRSHTDKRMAEQAIAQLSDEEFFRRPVPSFNSVACIMRHVAGNLVSRWTDFLTTDGEKSNRDRESEFADWTGTRDELMQRWQQGFETFFTSLSSLTPDDLHKTITIRGEPHTVPQAIVRAMDHLAYHAGQILYVSRLVHSGEWKYITVAPKGTDAYNQQMRAGRGARPV